MKLTLVCIGKLSAAFLREGVAEYAGRINHYLPLTTLEIKEEKAGGKKADPQRIRDLEGEKLLAKIPEGAFTVVLDERGKQLGSEALAGFLEEQMVHGTGEIVLIIGGAYGLSDRVKARADRLLSLSAMTFTHQMARLFLLEQLYRALTIVRNEPYHNR